MGYDFGSELLSYINSDFINKLVLLYGKIILIYYLYLSLLSEMISLVSKDKKLITKYYLISISIFILLPFFSSITMHPQLYADFFYMKHPSFLPILYFLTEYGNPYIYTYILYLYIYIHIIFIYKIFSLLADLERKSSGTTFPPSKNLKKVPAKSAK